MMIMPDCLDPPVCDPATSLTPPPPHRTTAFTRPIPHPARQVLVTAIGLGLPRFGAVQLGSRVASYAAQLTASKNGHQAVIAMLEMEVGRALGVVGVFGGECR